MMMRGVTSIIVDGHSGQQSVMYVGYVLGKLNVCVCLLGWRLQVSTRLPKAGVDRGTR
jgi:hypothetical protein